MESTHRNKILFKFIEENHNSQLLVSHGKKSKYMHHRCHPASRAFVQKAIKEALLPGCIAVCVARY